MRRVDIFDSGFLYIESRQTPMHVGGVNLFQFPKGANRNVFMRRLGDAYRSVREFRMATTSASPIRQASRRNPSSSFGSECVCASATI